MNKSRELCLLDLLPLQVPNAQHIVSTTIYFKTIYPNSCVFVGVVCPVTTE